MRRVTAFLAATALAVLAGVPASGAPVEPEAGPAILAGPFSTPTTYYTLVAVAVVGEPLTFVNADGEGHNVLTVETGPTDKPWCDQFPEGRCPLLWSELIGLGEITPVLGTENLEAGETYEFYCGPHPGMRGLLLAVSGD